MKLLKTLGLVLLLTGTFAGGYVVRSAREAQPAPSGRRVVYYVDPMHPAYKSDKPGIAPDCGMQLEPVYADQRPAATPALPAGAITISPERQQIIGVKFATVEAGSPSRTIRAV